MGGLHIAHSTIWDTTTLRHTQVRIQENICEFGDRGRSAHPHKSYIRCFKEHLKKMSGTKISQFEGHMAEAMWRNYVKSNLYDGFFNLVKSVYPLNAQPTYNYTTPLFDTWAGVPSSEIGDWDIRPGNADAESESEVLSTPEVSSFPRVESDSDDIESIPRNQTASDNTIRRREEQAQQVSVVDELIQGSDLDKTLTPFSENVHIADMPSTSSGTSIRKSLIRRGASRKAKSRQAAAEPIVITVDCDSETDEQEPHRRADRHKVSSGTVQVSTKGASVKSRKASARKEGGKATSTAEGVKAAATSKRAPTKKGNY